MGMTYRLFVKPLVVFAVLVAALSGVYLLPEYWPDHPAASDAILHKDTAALAKYLARGLDPEERAQWRSYLRRSLFRRTSVPLGRAGESLLDYALGKCATAPALQLVEAGADVSPRDKWGWTLLGRAAGCRNPSLISAMLRRGADPNADEPDGGTVTWEPTNLGWRRRPFGDTATDQALDRAGARCPSRPPISRR